jgi:hypothetical protein
VSGEGGTRSLNSWGREIGGANEQGHADDEVWSHVCSLVVVVFDRLIGAVGAPHTPGQRKPGKRCVDPLIPVRLTDRI